MSQSFKKGFKMEKKLEVGKLYYIDSESEEKAVIDKAVREYRGSIDGHNFFTDGSGDFFWWEYAVPIEPEEPEYIDVEVGTENYGFYSVQCPHCSSFCYADNAISDIHFAGYLFADGLNYQHFRDIFGVMCKAVRFKKECN